jgi:hypothetical protein
MNTTTMTPVRLRELADALDTLASVLGQTVELVLEGDMSVVITTPDGTA